MRRAVVPKQLHAMVPSSPAPPIPEWAGHFWYVLRCGALQARAEASDEDVTALVAWFHAFRVTTPCPDCRKHYADDWERWPFTADHAHDPVKAMAWVEDLRARIQGRKAGASSAVASASATATAPVHRPTAAIQHLAVKSALLRARNPMACKTCRGGGGK